MNTSHLDSLETRLHNEEQRLANATSNSERQWRKIWVEGIKREIKGERKFLGLDQIDKLTDEELLAELGYTLSNGEEYRTPTKAELQHDLDTYIESCNQLIKSNL